MEVDGLPVGVVARVEGPAVGIEFIGEYESILSFAVGEGSAGFCPLGCVGVDQRREIRDAGDLYIRPI